MSTENTKKRGYRSYSVSIIGAGWLGLPLAQHLKQTGCALTLSSRAKDKVTKLTQSGWHACQFELGQSVPAELAQNDIAIINIAAGRKQLAPEEYSEKVLKLVQELISQNVQYILFVSTTSVYGSQSGKITEASPVKPNTNSGTAHVQIEEHLRQHLSGRTTILRLAGLVGDERHPVKFLSGKVELTNPDHAVNLVHRKDVINAITAIIENQVWGKTLHLCSLEHPSRQEYYQWAAKQLGLVLPEFVTSDGAAGKLIDASNTIETLGINLEYASPFDMLSQN